MKILIDSDACPVKNLVHEIALDEGIHILFITSISHYTSTSNIDKSKFIYVDNMKESADIEIMNRLEKGDIVVTDDYGLASLVLGKKCYAISTKGYIYNKDNINSLLTSRYLAGVQRKMNKRIKSSNKKRQNYDDEKFKEEFLKLIHKIRRN